MHGSMQVLHDRKYLAVADEEGYVSVLDTSAPLPRGLHDEGSTPAQWLAHHNAIFDLAWCKVGAKLIPPLTAICASHSYGLA